MKERILELFRNCLPEIDFLASNTLAEDGTLDSFAMTIIISELSMEFGIEIPFEELDADNFNSIDSIIELVKRCPKSSSV